MGLHLVLLTDDEYTTELCTRYWQVSGDGQFLYKVSDLVPPPGISVYGLPAFVAEHCHAQDTEIPCVDCGTPYCYRSRSDYEQRARARADWLCAECRQEQAELQQMARQTAENERRALVQQHYTAEPVRIAPYEDLAFKEAVALLALLRLGAAEDLSVIEPVDSSDGVFAPTTDLACDLLRLLYHNGRIRVAPNSHLDAFTEDVQTFYLFRVAWIPPVDGHGSFRGVLDEIELIFRERSWPCEWFGEAYDCWCELALHECLQYLRMCMTEHGFEFTAGDKTKQVVSGVLQSYSVSQAYTFIWRAAKDAAAYYLRDRVPKAQAANSVVSRIQHNADRARAAGWQIEPYRRDRRAPESMVSHVLYRVALMLGDAGIDHIPHTVDASSDVRASENADPLE